VNCAQGPLSGTCDSKDPQRCAVGYACGASVSAVDTAQALTISLARLQTTAGP
jgi:hypothetical protein